MSKWKRWLRAADAAERAVSWAERLPAVWGWLKTASLPVLATWDRVIEVVDDNWGPIIAYGLAAFVSISGLIDLVRLRRARSPQLDAQAEEFRQLAPDAISVFQHIADRDKLSRYDRIKPDADTFTLARKLREMGVVMPMEAHLGVSFLISLMEAGDLDVARQTFAPPEEDNTDE